MQNKNRIKALSLSFIRNQASDEQYKELLALLDECEQKGMIVFRYRALMNGAGIPNEVIRELDFTKEDKKHIRISPAKDAEHFYLDLTWSVFDITLMKLSALDVGVDIVPLTDLGCIPYLKATNDYWSVCKPSSICDNRASLTA